jgi:putative ABC transport system ATP-binding protein
MESEPAVAFRGVGKSYDEAGRRHVVLRDVDLEIRAGEVVAVLGRSGSGKSTLLNLVAGIDAPDTGDVLVGGVSVNRLSDEQRTLLRRRSIGFVYQFFNLIPTLTVIENVRLPLDLVGSGTDPLGAACDMLRQVDLEDRRDAFPDRLSGGEQQRVAIARALVANPPIVLADEPTGNLDADTGDRVLDLLLRLTRDRGRTMLVATHSRAVAAAADRVLRIDDGHVVAATARSGSRD